MAKLRRRKPSRIVLWLSGLSSWIVVQTATPAHAGLGDEVAVVEKDRATLQARLMVSKRANYDIHELATDAGATVREFVGRDNKVFAVSWSGGFRPNLREVLSTHYDRYLEGSRNLRRVRRPARIEVPGMVVFMGSYLRSFYGYAYLTEQLPDGFQAEDMQ
jgi:hypothetical protein